MSDSYIFGWNSRIFELPKGETVMVAASYTNNTGIDVKIKPNSFVSNDNILFDPPVKYRLVFSVASSCSEEFDEILEQLHSIEIDNHVWKTAEKKQLVTAAPNDKVTKKSSVHRIGKVEYVRHEWTFVACLSDVMTSCFLVESAVAIFEKCWGVDEEGQKVCLMKYPIGSVVCVDGDKSQDWLVLDWLFDTLSPSFHESYSVVSMVERPGSAIVQYDRVVAVVEGRISWSRNSRIDDILE